MTRPTDISAEIPLLNQRLGSEYPNPIADATDTDRASELDVYIPTGSAISFVQSKVNSETNATPSVTTTFDDDPTLGNLLVALFTCRAGASPTFPSGWVVVHVEATTTNGGPTWLLYKEAQVSEPAAVTVTGVSNYKRLAVAEFTGGTEVDQETSLSEQSAAMSYSVGPITPTVDASLLIGWVNAAHKTNFTTDAAWTALDEDGQMPTGGTDGPTHTFAYKILSAAAATSFAATSVDLVPWVAGVAAFISPGFGSVSIGNLGTDGDDATYSGPYSVYLIDLQDEFRIIRARFRLAWSAAGSVALTIEGANVADFSDAVELDTATVAATGSFTAQDVAMNWQTGSPAPYRYYRLTLGTAARLHAWEMYEATFSPPITEHGELDGRSDTDQHPAAAVSFTPAGTIAATNVQAALEEVAGEAVQTTGGGGEEFQAHGAAGAAETIDLANGNYHALTLDADVTLTFTAPASGRIRALTLEVTQDGTGGWTITWPGSVVWPGGSAPILDGTAGAVQFFVFHTRDAGTTWYGFPVGGSGGDPADDTRVWMPLTTVVGGVPELVWDGDDSLIPDLVPI